ncbi:hypothetical protein STENM223S_06735 [Streptomyces tendae]
MPFSRYQLAIVKSSSSVWPANMFAKSRTACVNGRTSRFEKNSIASGSRRAASRPLGSARLLKKPTKPTLLKVTETHTM